MQHTASMKQKYIAMSMKKNKCSRCNKKTNILHAGNLCWDCMYLSDETREEQMGCPKKTGQPCLSEYTMDFYLDLFVEVMDTVDISTDKKVLVVYEVAKRLRDLKTK